MYPRHGTIVRPLLDCRRDELRAWLDARGAEHVEDETNTDVRVPRNRVRAELVPLLAERFNPSAVDVLADQAALARETWQWMEEASAPFLATGELDVAELNRLPAALRRVIIWRALSEHAGGRHISFDHVRDVIRLMQTTEGSLDLPGQQLQRIGTRIVIKTGKTRSGSRGSQGSLGSLGSSGSQGASGSASLENQRNPQNHQNPANLENPTNLANPANLANSANLYSYPLSSPGEVVVPESGCVVSVAPATGDVVAERRATVGNGPIAVVRGDRLTESLVVRNRRPGDRFQPVGLRGRKKLQDLFVDQKVARAERDAVPLVVDARDRIVWVAGFGIDEAFRVTDAAQAVLLLRLTRA
jgi:tRNA(Ile)-lysidine synthase